MIISGEPENVKWPILIDQVSSVLRWFVPVIILLFVLPKASLIPIIIEWVRRKIPFMTIFVALVACQYIFLSG